VVSGSAAVAWVAVAVATCAGPARSADYAKLGREVERLVADRFYDPVRADAWVKAHAGYADTVRDQPSFARATNLALADLRASHTRLYTPDEVAYYGLLAIFAPSLKIAVPTYEGIGVDYADGRFVRFAFAGGPAEAAGLKRGDEIVAAGGRPFEPIGSFRGRTGTPVVLTIRRLADGPTSEVRVTPRSITPTQEWREAIAKGAKIVRRGDKSIGYVHLFSAAGEWPKELLEELISGPFRPADALVLDFRDGWGGANPDFVNLFNPTPPALTFIERDGNRRQYDPQWRKPLVLLIDGGTRSGKETVAHTIRTRKLGTLIGERTAGAVVAGRPFILSDRSLLFLAVADVLVEGQHLEGVGVAPDVEVAAPVPYADGADPQVDAALDAATRAASAR
jgi:carboxyl-terminal processing protease